MKPCLIYLRPMDRRTQQRVDVRVADGPSAETYGTAGTPWQPALVTRPRMSIELMSLTMDGKVQAGQATFTIGLNMLDAASKRWLYWSGCQVIINNTNILEGPTAVPDFWGYVTSAKYDQDKQELAITAEASTLFIDKPLLTKSFGGGGGADGDAALRGTLMPAGFGVVKNMPPVFFDTTRNIGMIDGYGNTISIDWLGEGLSSFGAAVADYATYAALANAIDNKAVKPGQWATCAAQGLIGLGAPPTGVITVHATFGSNRIGAICKRIISLHAGVAAARIDTAAFDALDQLVNRPVHYWTTAQRNVKDLLEALAASANATPLVTFQNAITITRAVRTAPKLTLDRSGSVEPRVIDWQSGDDQPPYYILQARAARPGSVLSDDQVNYVDALIDRGLYDNTVVYRAGNFVELADGSQWLYQNATPAAGHAPPTNQAADANGNVQDAYWYRRQPPKTIKDFGYTGDLDATKGAQLGKNLTDSSGTVQTDASVKNSGVTLSADGKLAGAGGGQVTYTGIGGGDVGKLATINLTTAAGGLIIGLLQTVNASNGLVNTQITIGIGGNLVGAGGGQVTIGGLGYAGDLRATSADNMLPNAALLLDATGVVNGGWVTQGAVARVVAGQNDPANYYRGTSNASQNVVVTPMAPIAAGATSINFAYWKRSSENQQQIATDVYWFDSGQNLISTSRQNSYVGNANTWTQWVSSFAVPTGAVFVRWYINLVSNANQTHDVGAVRASTSELGATNGATWGSNLSGRPANLSILIGTEGIQNASITIASNGALGGAGGGQVTFSGIGGGAVGQLAQINLTTGAGGLLIGLLQTTNAANGLVNTQITISSAGALSGGGGGQVTLPGIGYVGDPRPTNGDNMVPNAALALDNTGAVAAGWQTAGQETRTAASNGDPGAYYRGYSNNSPLQVYTPLMPMPPSPSFKLSYWKRSTENYQQVAVDVYYYDGSGNLFNTGRVSNSFLGAANYWAQAIATIGLAQNGAVYFRLVFGMVCGNGQYHDLAGVRAAATEYGADVTGNSSYMTFMGSNGRVVDARALNSSNVYGLRSLSAPPGFTASQNGSTATINIDGNGVLYNDFGQAISLPSASISGLALATKYYIWRNMPTDGSGSSYGYSTNLNDALGTTKTYLGYYTTPNASGGGGGGGTYGGSDCVSADAWVPTANRGVVRAREIVEGDQLYVLTEDLQSITTTRCTGNRPGRNLACTLRAGGRLTLAINTPMSQPDHSWIIAANVGRYQVAHMLDTDAREAVWLGDVDVKAVDGEIDVARISCNNGTYAASDHREGPFLMSHNLQAQSQKP